RAPGTGAAGSGAAGSGSDRFHRSLSCFPGRGMGNTTTTSLDLTIHVIAELRPVLAVLKRCDRNLEDQLRRAITSVALNLAEADGNEAGNRRNRLATALGSIREVRAGLRVAVAFGYVDGARVAGVMRQLDSIGAM